MQLAGIAQQLLQSAVETAKIFLLPLEPLYQFFGLPVPK
jgi:hypothetical protein